MAKLRMREDDQEDKVTRRQIMWIREDDAKEERMRMREWEEFEMTKKRMRDD